MSEIGDGIPSPFPLAHISFIVRAGYSYGVIKDEKSADRLWRFMYLIDHDEMAALDLEKHWRSQELMLLPQEVAEAIRTWVDAHEGDSRWERALTVKETIQKIQKVAYDNVALRWHWVSPEWVFRESGSGRRVIYDDTEFEPIAGRAIGDRNW